MSRMPDLPKEIWYVFVGIIVIWYLLANGTFWSTTETVVDSGVAVIKAGKTLCESKDVVMQELLKTAYDEAPENAKKILDKFRTGEKLTDCDYFQLYNSLKKDRLKNWALDESCNALVCSGI